MSVYNKNFDIKYKSELGAYIVYYEIVAILYRLPITKKEILFLAYLGYKGNTYNAKIRDSFVKEHKMSQASIYNMILKLKKYKLLIKENKKTSINRSLIVPADNLTKMNFNISLSIENEHQSVQTA